MSNLSGRIPGSVEWEIEELLEQYQDNITSILGQFPALQVCSVGGQGCTCRMYVDRVQVPPSPAGVHVVEEGLQCVVCVLSLTRLQCCS